MSPPSQEKHQQIEATVADTHLAGPLDIALGAPVLVITRHYVDARGQSALVFRSSYRADRYYYTIDLAHPPDESAAPKRSRAPGRARKVG